MEAPERLDPGWAGGQGGWTREAPELRGGWGALFFPSLLGWAGLALHCWFLPPTLCVLGRVE